MSSGVVFTIPDILNVLARHAPEVVYAILLRCAGQALLDLGLSRLGARMGVLTVLHTWGQRLPFHPHVHCVVPGGGFSRDGRRWVRVPKVDFLFAVKPLSRRFSTLFRNAVREAYADGTLKLPTEIVADAQALDLLLARSFKTDWHAYAKRPFGGPGQVLAYLANYTHRIAISNHRILSFDGQSVTFSPGGLRGSQRAEDPVTRRSGISAPLPPARPPAALHAGPLLTSTISASLEVLSRTWHR